MQNQDENIRVLDLENKELQRQIDLLRKQVPDKAGIEEALVNSTLDVSLSSPRITLSGRCPELYIQCKQVELLWNDHNLPPVNHNTRAPL